MSVLSYPHLFTSNLARKNEGDSKKFVSLDPEYLPLVTGFSPESSQRLTASLKFAMQCIIKRCQHVERTVDSEEWIPGWLDPLRHAVNFVLSAKPAHAPHPELIERQAT